MEGGPEARGSTPSCSEGAGFRRVVESGSSRVKFTCLCTNGDGSRLFLGTTTGAVHVYVDSRPPGGGVPRSFKFHRIVSVAEDEEKDGAAVAFVSYRDDVGSCAVALGSGRVHVVPLEPPSSGTAQGRVTKGGVRLKHDAHFGGRVTQLDWVAGPDGAVRLASGDEDGKVFLLDVTAGLARAAKSSSHHALLASKLETGLQQVLKRGDRDGRDSERGRNEWDFGSPVVQLSGSSRFGVLAVSTMRASFLVDVATGTSSQIGKKARNGVFGCCLPVELPDSDVFNALGGGGEDDDGQCRPVCVAARPGRRLWVAVGSDVKGTIKLSWAGPAGGGLAGAEVGWLEEIGNPEEGNLQLGQLFPFGQDLVSISAKAVSVVSLKTCSVARVWGLCTEGGDGEGSPRVWVLPGAEVIFLLDENSSQVAMHDRREPVPRPGLALRTSRDSENGRQTTEKEDSRARPALAAKPPVTRGVGEGEAMPIEKTSPDLEIIAKGKVFEREKSVGKDSIVVERPKIPRAQAQKRQGTRHRRAKSKVVEISISKREDAIDPSSLGSAGDFFSTEQELNQLISNTISMTLESQKLGEANGNRGPGPSSSAVEHQVVPGDVSPERGEEGTISQSITVEEDQSTSAVTEEACLFLSQNRDVVFDSWEAYLGISAEEVREVFQSWCASLSPHPSKQVEMQCKNTAVEELAAAFQTLDASLAILPLLQWFHIYRQHTGKVLRGEVENILLTACDQLGLEGILKGDSGGRNGGFESSPGEAPEESELLRGTELDIERALLSRPSKEWCAILSSLALDTPALEEEKLRNIFQVGWTFVGREFAFELMNQLVRGGKAEHDFRSLSHFLVEMQRREGEQDRVAADILEPIGHRVSSGNPFTALEIALNHDLVDAETTEDSLREAENLLHEGGHWGLSFEGGLCCPVCGLKIAGENAVVFPSGEVYHERCCPEDAPCGSMPRTLV